MTRRNFPQTVIAAAFLRAEGRCEGKRADGDDATRFSSRGDGGLTTLSLTQWAANL